MSEEYPKVKANEWVQPCRKGYKMMCCDCGLVHELDFRIVKDKRGRSFIQFRARRDDEETAEQRDDELEKK